MRSQDRLEACPTLAGRLWQRGQPEAQRGQRCIPKLLVRLAINGLRAFPLTPARSRGERENGPPTCGATNVSRSWDAAARNNRLRMEGGHQHREAPGPQGGEKFGLKFSDGGGSLPTRKKPSGAWCKRGSPASLTSGRQRPTWPGDGAGRSFGAGKNCRPKERAGGRFRRAGKPGVDFDL